VRVCECDVVVVCPPVLCFRVKFYATDPMRLKEEITRCAMDIYNSNDDNNNKNDNNNNPTYVAPLIFCD